MTKWPPGTILRHKITGAPLLVLKQLSSSTIVVDMQNPQNPTPSLILLQREYDNWCPDKELVSQEVKKKSWVDESELIWSKAITI